MTLTEVTTVIDIAEQIDDGHGDPGDLAHYVDQGASGQDLVTAMVNGTEFVALCGYRWVPSRDPRNKPVCKPCTDALAEILRSRS